MGKLHGSVFIFVGILVSIISFVIGESMTLFMYLGVAFFIFGVVRLFIVSGKLRPKDQIEREIMQRRLKNQNNQKEQYLRRQSINSYKGQSDYSSRDRLQKSTVSYDASGNSFNNSNSNLNICRNNHRIYNR